MANETALIPEYIFISYDGVIKNYQHVILSNILRDYKDDYKDYIDIKLLDDCNEQQLMGLIIKSLYPNVLQYLSTKKFDYDATLFNLYNLYPNLFLESRLLNIGQSIYVLLKQKFTKKIYMWTPSYDERIHFDIQTLYNDMEKIEYITGPFMDVVNVIENKISSYILNDARLAIELIHSDKVAYSNIMVANYGYNYTLSKNKTPILNIPNVDELSKEKIFKLGIFDVTNEYEIIKK